MVDFRNRLRGAEGAARRAVGRLKTWFEPPLDTDARPLEIREAIIDHVEARAEPAAVGRRVLPHNHATATILAATPEDRAALEPAVADLDEAIRTRLAEVRCPVPNGFELEVTFIKRPKPGWREGQRFAVDYDSRPVTRGAASREPALPVLRVAIIRGKTAERRYAFTEPHVRIGRTASPTDHMGRPRHNHIVFVEGDDEHSATVGRAHASIQYDSARREYRLFDDGSSNGTRVVRGAATLNVAPRNPVGVTILSGDEVQLGTASIRVEIG